MLIIGWNDRIHALIEEVVHTAQRLGEEHKPAIVVLCDPYDPAMYHQLYQKLDPEVRSRCRLMVRSGNPLEIESLERVDFAYARSIILVATASAERSERSLSDITLAKVLMSMKAQVPEPKLVPNVAVEIAFAGNKLLAESVGWHTTEAVVADDIMGRLFCQALRFPGISRVYHRLLTDTFTDSVLLKYPKELGVVGKKLSEVVLELTEGIPVGLLREGKTQSDLELLNLECEIQTGDLVVLVTSRVPRQPKSASDAPGWELPEFSESANHRDILVVGWSTDLLTFLVEISANPGEACRVTLLWETALTRERERLERWAKEKENLKLTFDRGALLDESDLERVKIEQYDKILLLADQNQKPLVADAENVLRYVLLTRYVKARNLNLDLVVELNDEDNRALLKGGTPDVLMTAEILSHLLAQVSTHRSLMWIYEELFTKGGAELRLRPLDRDTTFEECQRACLVAKAVGLGYKRDEHVIFNPNWETRLTPTDQLIVVELE